MGRNLSGKLQTIDGMRGIAAISVLLFHLGGWTTQSWIFSHGYLAVDFFFCLSGFVMAYAYGQRLSRGEMDVAEFVTQRLIRLYPVILLGMLLGAGYYLTLSLFGRSQSFGIADLVLAVALNVLLIPFSLSQSALGPGIYPINTPFWSILFELIANFAWAVFLRRMPPLLLFLLSSVIAISAFSLLDGINVGGLTGQFWWGILRVLVGFSAGLLVFQLRSAGSIMNAIPRLNSYVLLVILAALFAVPDVVGVWFDLACAIVVFPFLTLLGTVAGEKDHDSVLEWLGSISYPLYGIHRPISLLIATGLIRFSISHAEIIAVVLGFAASIISAHFSFYFFDQPIRRMLRDKFSRAGRTARLAAP